MQREKAIRSIVVVVLIVSLIGTTYYAIEAYNQYSEAENRIIALSSDVSVEVLRITARDNTQLKALFYINQDVKDLTDKSIPLIIGCHGMSDDYNTMSRTYATFLSLGYAVLAPEFRGHGSNTASSTLGWEEPFDIIEWLDFIEESNVAINVSQSGIMGHSMGAMYATLAYIIESKGEGRFKALVEQSGVNNLTREIEFLASGTEAIGDIPFTQHQYEKNPVNHVNSTFPKNVLIMHGDKDSIVDYQCGVDFYKAIDPDESREDVEFITLEGEDHSTNNIPEVIKMTVAWLEKYVRGNEFNWENIEIKELEMPFSPASRAKEAVFNASIFFILVVACFAYVISPNIFETENNLKSKDSTERKKPINYKITLIAIYLGGMFLAGVIGLIPNLYLANELAFPAIVLIIILVLMSNFMKSTNKYIQDDIDAIKKSFPIGPTIIWIIAFSIGMSLYPLITSSRVIEDTYLVPGYRVTWWIPFMIGVLVSQFILNQIFISKIQDTHRTNLKSRIVELGLCGFISFVGYMLWGIWHLETSIEIPAWGIGGSVVPILAFMFALLGVMGSLLSQLTEKIAKSSIIGYMTVAAFVPIFVGGTSIIFFF